MKKTKETPDFKIPKLCGATITIVHNEFECTKFAKHSGPHGDHLDVDSSIEWTDKQAKAMRKVNSIMVYLDDLNNKSREANNNKIANRLNNVICEELGIVPF